MGCPWSQEDATTYMNQLVERARDMTSTTKKLTLFLLTLNYKSLNLHLIIP